jgi:eukaryotic-like serine/threonine-protein kinase
MDPFLNREVGQRYRVAARLGQGAHARVYRAWDAVRRADVALKIFDPNNLDAQQAEAARQFEVWEGSAILPLLEVHPNYAEGETTVMPVMDRTLADVDPILASEALYYTRRILTALEFCHGRGVVHGDLKPSNVFINAAGVAFLGDFGVADFLPGNRRGHTLEYAAPELLAGDPRSAATDVWAAAVTVYEMLTGELPFGSRAVESEGEIAARITRAQYGHPDQLRPYLPLRVRSLFRQCFVADPNVRSITTADGMRLAVADLDVRAEWIQWAREGYLYYWEGFQVAGGRRTGVRYSATVSERPRLNCCEAEVKRAQPGGDLRRWPGVAAYRGTRAEAIHRMVLWMRTITATGHP